MQQTIQNPPHTVKKTQTQRRSWIRRLGSQYQLVFLSIPFVLLVILFNYVPLWGWLAAFQDYKPFKGVTGSEFVGLSNFKVLFADPHFLVVLRNTLVMSGMSLITGFVGAITLALLLNEIQVRWFKRIVQTVTYIPHFVSMVVIVNIVLMFLSPDGGFINNLLMNLGWMDKPIYFMGKGEWFWVIHTITGLWKELGWSTIIYLAVLAGINSELYEAAAVDGASRLRKMLHISIPGLMPTATLLLIMSVGSLINTGYESQMLLGNPLVIDYSEVLDLYALSVSFGGGDYSVGVALSMFKGFVSIVLVVIVNFIARKLSDTRLF